MFGQLKTLLQSGKNKSQTMIGRIIDCLKKIAYFKKLDNNLGSEYLVSLIPFIKPFVLREGFALINQNDKYVHVEGDLRIQDNRFGGDRPFEAGKVIDLREMPQVSFCAFTDCNMIKINRGVGSSNLIQKKLLQSERQRTRKFKDYQRLLQMPQNKQKLQILHTLPFFSVLGAYDSYQIAHSSILKIYPQAASTHQFNEKVEKIGLVVSGRIKLSNSKKQKKSGIDKRITWFAEEQDWIGLEEFLWEEPFKSTGQAFSIQAVVMWIPCDIFQAKFNNKTNYEAISRLISLIKTKKLLFDRSYNCRKNKLDQLQEESNANKQFSPQLINKMEALKDGSTKKKNHISRARLQGARKLQVPLPDLILHKDKNLQQDPTYFPRVKQKVIFFPEEYASIPVSTVHQKQMFRLKRIMKKQEPEQPHKQIQFNPQILYKTIYNKISYKYSARVIRSMPKEPTRDDRGHLHHNCSIYNNFRVGNRKESENIRKNKTLDILPHLL